MSIALAQSIAPTCTPTGSTITFTYVPLSPLNLVDMVVNIATASRTLMSVVSAAGQVTWTITTGTPVALNSTNHLYSVMGVVNSAVSHTVTCTFSGTPGTSPVPNVGILELDPTIPGLTTFTLINFSNNSGTSASVITATVASGLVGDVFSANYLSSSALTGNVTVQPDFTYDQTDGAVYGQMATARTIPATGFTQTSSGIFYAGAIIARPTIVLPPSPIPRMVSPYQGMF
jgi:hypothetical protein